ncbi:hypothetical protein ACVWW4_000307 [Bradyrhizobium sp. LB7.1]
MVVPEYPGTTAKLPRPQHLSTSCVISSSAGYSSTNLRKPRIIQAFQEFFRYNRRCCFEKRLI